MSVFNGPSMRLRVAILEIRHRQLLCSSEPKMKINIFKKNYRIRFLRCSYEAVEPMRGFNGLLICMRVAILEIHHWQLLCSSEPKMKINFFTILSQFFHYFFAESVF